jgi:hypothetical protein
MLGPHCHALRVHAIVLTRDRPETMRRCIATALNTMSCGDALTVIDDSTDDYRHTTFDILRHRPYGHEVAVRHIPSALLTSAIKKGRQGLAVWLDRTGSRDIAPLRNLSLLLSTLLPSETTVLIDDDMCSYDINLLHHAVTSASQGSGMAVVGADISGINENDTISRLDNALDVIATSIPNEEPVSTSKLFGVSTSLSEYGAGFPQYASGGYLGFHLTTDRLFAFPPGYNEDWLWCILHQTLPGVGVSRSPEVVVHDPPSVRQTTRDDFLFELSGDLVFDCLMVYRASGWAAPAEALQHLASIKPTEDLLPATRARELSSRAAGLKTNPQALALVREHGLAVLESMLITGDLEMDGQHFLTIWCRDALAKQQAFSATLGDAALMSHVSTAVTERRV